ncbi:MAG: hypothetical protein K1X74_20710 [Pirellulales bacterium]|nr:hypothetical protein [Pirellulales bacterium]
MLVGQPPQTMASLIQATGVTRTAVTEQLNDLLGSGFVRRTLERAGRGRPRHRYEATELALRTLFANNQRLLAPALVDAVTEIGGAELRRQVLEGATQRLIEHYRQQITAQDPGPRFTQLAELLAREGVVVDVEQRPDRVVLHQRTCPFVDMVDDSRAVCAVEKAMMCGVVGFPVEMVGCRLDGNSGCTFQVHAAPPPSDSLDYPPTGPGATAVSR